MRTIALFILCMAALQAAPEPERVEWNHTPEAFAGKRVLVRLATGVRIEGTWISVTPSACTMKVEKTSSRKRVAKGTQVLPRVSILRIEIQNRRVRGRVIGTIAGVYAGAAIAYAGSRSQEALGQSSWGLAAIAGGVAGYFVGRSLDRATREIVLVP
jgi:hypothetical protein